MNEREAKETVEFVRKLMRGRMELEGLATRDVAEISHVVNATVWRFLKGRNIDAITFLKFIDWMKP
jgi:predicted transcriptional regulator